MTTDLISRASSLPVSFSILSSFKFYGEARGHGLPGTWFVELLGSIGVLENTVRQGLYRMEQQQVLTAEKEGRTKIYSVTRSAAATLEVGTGKLFRDERQEPWDGLWTLVHMQLGPERRVERNRVLDVLRVEGFAPLAERAFIHPRERSRRVLEAARALGVGDGVSTFRARRTDVEDLRVTAALWDLAALRLKYERFVRDFEPLASRDSESVDPRLAFAGRLVIVNRFLEAAWEDPDLPAELLPEDWPADRARQIVRLLYDRWKPAGLAFGDAILDRVTKREIIAREVLESTPVR